ncbi:hypothetical protein [Pararobbsia alpina]|uniref:Uncharacterized protein n=1 Tax=Pararobbsia alpina TaxID=621374 RepID=A0A6S7CGZ4_9BURK|nr:hypothetical protein [Pararobbsia alpina]CAB3779869.1 hypothetical protein LMG28138_00916 [Pararobbsia alpina]
MNDFLPDYLLREQSTVGALFTFLAIRYATLSVGLSHSVRRSTLSALYIGLACLFCLPQLADLLSEGTLARMAWPILEGKVLGCVLAYFGASALYSNLRYQQQ